MDTPLWQRKLADFAEYIPLPEGVAVYLLARITSGNNTGSLLYKRIYEQIISVKKTAGIINIRRFFAYSIWPMTGYNWTSGLEKLNIPVMVINSNNDLVNSVRAMSFIEKQLPKSYGYKLINGGWHFFQYHYSDQVIKCMEEFYNKLRSEGI